MYPLGAQPDLDLAERTLFLEVSPRLVEGTAAEAEALEEMVGLGVAFSPVTQLVQEQPVREITERLVRSVLSQVKIHMVAEVVVALEQLVPLQHQYRLLRLVPVE